jgi:magnesium transporter
MNYTEDRFAKPALEYARQDFPRLRQDWTVQQALDSILEQGVGEQIVYFYVTDSDSRLVGVLPTRRLLMSSRDMPLSRIMESHLLTLPQNATVLDACEFFVMYRKLAYPILDEQRRMLGIVDISMFNEEILTLQEPQDAQQDIFEMLGFHMERIRNASPLKVFALRFPWLLSTIAGGMLCALLSSAFSVTLAGSLVLAFFLTLVLGLGDSLSVQSLTLTLRIISNVSITWRWYWRSLRKELPLAGLLGLSCGALVGLVVVLWKHSWAAALVIGGSLVGIMTVAAFIGMTVPAVIHAFKLDPKVAAGPISLAITDLSTLFIYFTVAHLVLS